MIYFRPKKESQPLNTSSSNVVNYSAALTVVDIMHMDTMTTMISQFEGFGTSHLSCDPALPAPAKNVDCQVISPATRADYKPGRISHPISQVNTCGL